MINWISDKIVVVTGPVNSAVYDFNEGKVYSINEAGTTLFNKFLKGNCALSVKEKEEMGEIQKAFKIKNFKCSEYIFDAIPKKKLNFVWLEVTNRCPFKCIHCYEGQEHKECENPLSFEEWKNIISNLAKMNVNELRFIGGEPTVYARLNELIDYCKELGIKKVSIFSNLYTIDKERLFNSIVKNDVEVHFAIYGSYADVHDKVTQVRGSFDKLILNIKKLQKNDVKLISHVVIMRENENEVEKIYKLLEKLGITKIKYDEYRQVGDLDDKHTVLNSRLKGQIPNFKASIERFWLSNYINTCWYGKCVISASGDVYPCEMERNYKYGNIRDNTISDIIHSDTIDNFWFLSFNKIETCKQCELRFACIDCRPLALGVKNNIYQKNPRCGYNPYTGCWN